MVAGPQEVGNFSYLVLEPQHLKVEGKIDHMEGSCAQGAPKPRWLLSLLFLNEGARVWNTLTLG